MGGLLAVASPVVLSCLMDGGSLMSEVSSLGAYSWARLLPLAVVEVHGDAGPGHGPAAGPALARRRGPRLGGEGETGTLMAANTVGAILGPLAVAFLIAPVLGLWRSVAVLGSLVALAGVWTGLGRRSRLAGAVAVVVALVALVRADPSGARASRAGRAPGLGARGEPRHDGRPRGPARSLDHGEQRVRARRHGRGRRGALAGAPAAAAPSAPRRVAFLGLGTGITAGASLLHHLNSIVLLEIVPEAVKAARESFAGANGQLLSEPRSRGSPTTAAYLRAAPGGFDVIVGDLLVRGAPERPSSTHGSTSRRSGARWPRTGCSASGCVYSSPKSSSPS